MLDVQVFGTEQSGLLACETQTMHVCLCGPAAGSLSHVIDAVRAGVCGRRVPQHLDLLQSLAVQLCVLRGHGCCVSQRQTMVVVCADDGPCFGYCSACCACFCCRGARTSCCGTECKYHHPTPVMVRMVLICCRGCGCGMSAICHLYVGTLILVFQDRSTLAVAYSRVHDLQYVEACSESAACMLCPCSRHAGSFECC